MNSEKVQYWTNMRERAARNLATVSGCTEPEDERDVKDRLAYVFKRGDCEDRAEAVVEACEWTVAYLELRKHEEASHQVVGMVK